jgi:transportin-3
VLRAVAALFHAEDGSARSAADRWLEAWQQTPGAWSVADALLHEPASPMEAQHFCAQTLKAKSQRDFEELPPEAAASLRESLLQLLLRFSRGAPPVRTQLCLALAALAAHLPAASWPADGDGGAGGSLLTSPPQPGSGGNAPSGNVVRWFAHRFRNEPPEAALPCVLEMLTVLPQEVDAQAIALRPERRREFAAELRAAVPDALDVLGGCLSAPGDRVRSQVLEAFAPWLRLASDSGMVGGAGGPLPAQALLSSPLVAASLEGLGQESTFHASVDAVCELVWATVDPATASPKPELAPLMARIAPTALALRPRFALAARRAAAEAAGRGDGGDGDLGADDWDDDEDTAKDMARLFAEVAEACIHPLAEAAARRQADAAAPIEAMLEVAGHPDPEIRSISFSFWHKLSRVVVTGSVDAWLQEDEWGGGGGGGGGGEGDDGGAAAGAGGGPASPHGGGHGGGHHHHHHHHGAGGGDGGSATTSGGGMLEAGGGGAAGAGTGGALDAERAARAEFLRPAFERLLRAVREAMRLPEMIDTWQRSERLDWRDARHDLGEVLLDAALALGPQRSLELLTAPLQEMSGAGAAAGSPASGAEPPAFSWRTAELALACLRAAHRAAPPAGDPNLESLLAALPSLPGPNDPLSSPRLAETAALMVASFGGWLSRTLALGRGGALPAPLLGMLVRGLQHPVSATASSFAARHLAHDCGAHMAGCVAELMELYSRALRCGAAAGVLGGGGGVGGGATTPRSPTGVGMMTTPPNSAAPLPISEEDVLQLLEAVVMAVTRSVPAEDLGQAVAALAAPVLEPLQAAVAALDRAAAEAAVAAHVGGGDAPARQQAAQAEADAASAALLPLVDRLAALFQTVGAARPAVAADVLARSWPALELGLSRAAATAHRSTAAERLCRALRYGVKASSKHCAPLLPSLLATLPSHFAATREPALLFVVSELVKAFGDDPSADAAVGPILAGLLAPTCATLSSPAALEAEPEMVDDVFLLAGRALSYAPRLALTPQLLPPLLDVALLGVLVQHREACGSALAFLTRLFDPRLPATLPAEQLALLQAQLARVGPPFMRLALAGVAGTLPAGLVSEVAHCLGAALSSMGGQGLRWFADAVAVIPDVAALPTDRDNLVRRAAALVSHACGGGGGEQGGGGGAQPFLLEAAAVAAAAVTGPGAHQHRQQHRQLGRTFEQGVYELADLCRRNRRARAEAQRALLPVELHGLIFV